MHSGRARARGVVAFLVSQGDAASSGSQLGISIDFETKQTKKNRSRQKRNLIVKTRTVKNIPCRHPKPDDQFSSRTTRYTFDALVPTNFEINN